MSNDLLQLRRAACEALGYRQVDLISKTVWRVGLHPFVWGLMVEYDHSNPGNYGQADELPAIEADPVVSEPMFLAWLQRNRYKADITIRPDGQAWIDIGIHLLDDIVIASVVAPTLSQARALAIVEGHEKSGTVSELRRTNGLAVEP